MPIDNRIKFRIFTVGIASYMTDKYYSMYVYVTKEKRSFTDADEYCDAWDAPIAYPLVSFSILRSFRRVSFTQVYYE